MILDTRDPKVVAELTASGLIWTAAQPVIVRACKRIAAGELAMPDNVPPVWRSYIESLNPPSRTVATLAPAKPTPPRALPARAKALASEWVCPDHGYEQTGTIYLSDRRLHRACFVCGKHGPATQRQRRKAAPPPRPPESRYTREEIDRKIAEDMARATMPPVWDPDYGPGAIYPGAFDDLASGPRKAPRAGSTERQGLQFGVDREFVLLLLAIGAFLIWASVTHQ